jgi:hypothetical protein
MNILKWIEQKLFTGEVLKDYGNVDDRRTGLTRLRTSVLLCRRRGKPQLVFRHTGTAPFGASVHYSMIEATPEALEHLAEIFLDAKRELARAHVV